MDQNKIMIKAEGLSMKFRLASDKVQSLKEFVITSLNGKLKFNDFWVFQNLNFEVHKGEIVGIVGRNGAGKSTLLKIIAGVLAPTRGKVTLGGNVVPMLELGSGFDFELSGRENIYLNGAILGYSKDLIDKNYDEILQFSELGDFIHEPIRNYSSGMMMRLAFSIATIINPEILIVDEILAVGDESFQKKSKRKMLELMGGGTTVLFVSHSLPQIREMCNRVIWLDGGKLRMQGDAKIVCDAYEDFINPKPAIQVEQKSARNIDAAQYCMDILLIYTDGLNISEKLTVLKEQFLAANLTSHEIYEEDVTEEIITQYQIILFYECDYQKNFGTVQWIKLANKRFVVLSDSQDRIEEWSEHAAFDGAMCHTQAGLQLWKREQKDIYWNPYATTEEWQSVSRQAYQERHELLRKNFSELKNDEEIYHFNQIRREADHMSSDKKNINVLTGTINRNEIPLIQNKLDFIQEQNKDAEIRLVVPSGCETYFSNSSFEIRKYVNNLDLARQLIFTDQNIDISRDEFEKTKYRRISEMIHIPYYFGERDSEADKNANPEQFTTIYTGYRAGKFMIDHMNPLTAFFLQNFSDGDNSKMTARLAAAHFEKGENVTVFVAGPADMDIDSNGVNVPVISRGKADLYAGIDKAYAMDASSFTFILNYANIHNREYYIEKWEPGLVAPGSLERFQANQSYCPQVKVEYFTSSRECQGWLFENYGKKAELISLAEE